MVQVMPINYNNDPYKQVNFMNGNEYQQHPTPPPLQHQQMPIPMPVPMINHLMPHPHHQPPNFFHPPPPPPPQPMYPNDQNNGQYMDYGNVGYHPQMGFMQPGNYGNLFVTRIHANFMVARLLL